MYRSWYSGVDLIEFHGQSKLFSFVAFVVVVIAVNSLPWLHSWLKHSLQAGLGRPPVVHALREVRALVLALCVAVLVAQSLGVKRQRQPGPQSQPRARAAP